MKLLRLLVAVPVIIMLLMMSSTPFVSCTKTKMDTVYIKHDSTIYQHVHDTTVVTDTVYDLTSGLVAYYSFNAGSLTDSSVYQNNIVYNNATPTADRYGRANNAYLFNGTSSYMRVAASPSLNPNNITLYAIVKPNGFYKGAYQANMILIKGWDQVLGQYQLSYVAWPNTNPLPDTTKEYFTGSFGDFSPPGSPASVNPPRYLSPVVQAGTWYKLAYTYDGLTAKLYLNGALLYSFSAQVPFNGNSLDLFIGRSNDPYGLYPYWLNAAIDEIRIYDRALPSQAIAQLSNLTN